MKIATSIIADTLVGSDAYLLIICVTILKAPASFEAGAGSFSYAVSVLSIPCSGKHPVHINIPPIRTKFVRVYGPENRVPSSFRTYCHRPFRYLRSSTVYRVFLNLCLTGPSSSGHRCKSHRDTKTAAYRSVC